MFSCDFKLITAGLSYLAKALGNVPDVVEIEASPKKERCRMTAAHEGKVASYVFKADVKTKLAVGAPWAFINSIYARGKTGFAVADNVLGYTDSVQAKGSFSVVNYKGLYAALQKENLINSEVISTAIGVVQKILINPLPNFQEPDVLLMAHKNKISVYVGDNFHISYVTMKLDVFQAEPVVLTMPLSQFRLLSALNKPNIYISNEQLSAVAASSLDTRTLFLPAVAANESLREIIEQKKDDAFDEFEIRGEFLESLNASCKLPDVDIQFGFEKGDSFIRCVSNEFEQKLPVDVNGKKSLSFTISVAQAKDWVKVAKHIKEPFVIQVLSDAIRIAFSDEHKCALLMTRKS